MSFTLNRRNKVNHKLDELHSVPPPNVNRTLIGDLSVFKFYCHVTSNEIDLYSPNDNHDYREQKIKTKTNILDLYLSQYNTLILNITI